MKHPLLQINHSIKSFEFSNYHSYILSTIHNKKDEDNVVKFWNISSTMTEEQQSAESAISEAKYPLSLQKFREPICAISW